MTLKQTDLPLDNQVALRLLQALGIEDHRVTSVMLHFSMDAPATVTVIRLLPDKDLETLHYKLPAILDEYEVSIRNTAPEEQPDQEEQSGHTCMKIGCKALARYGVIFADDIPNIKYFCGFHFDQLRLDPDDIHRSVEAWEEYFAANR